jgi:uncharacterized protein YecT (DUF1311 family)
MERLWAGDYSQLPAGQQLHALNLSAQQQQQAWLGQHQGNKVNMQGIQGSIEASMSLVTCLEASLKRADSLEALIILQVFIFNR